MNGNAYAAVYDGFPWELLTREERDQAVKICRTRDGGWSARQVAEHLGISSRTVQRHSQAVPS